MTTELIESSDPILITMTEETIQPLILLGSLRVNGVNDKEGLNAVKSAKSKLVNARTTIESERKIIKAPVIAEGERIDAIAKSMTALLAPIEKHLVDEIKRVETEVAKIESGKLDLRLEARIHRLKSIGGGNIPATVRTMTELEFDFLIQSNIEFVRVAREQAEAERLRDIELQRERDELAAQRRELDAQRAAQRVVQQQIDAENRRLADEAAVVARQDEFKRLERDNAGRIEAERIRKAELLPDRQKILNWADSCCELDVPELSAKASAAYQQCVDLVARFAVRIREIAEGM